MIDSWDRLATLQLHPLNATAQNQAPNAQDDRIYIQEILA